MTSLVNPVAADSVEINPKHSVIKRFSKNGKPYKYQGTQRRHDVDS